MDSITQITQNWATFMLMFDPDSGSGHVQRLEFASWTNGQNKRWAFIAWDNDITPTESADATSSFGNVLAAGGYNGTCVIYAPAPALNASASTGMTLAAFVCGSAASIDFAAVNGRITFAFKGQGGLVAGVTNATVADNLMANGYNFYGAYATANDQFRWFYPGTVSGVFQWLDSYVNQIWLNNALQLALMNLLGQVNSVPYNDDGYELIKAACFDPIDAATNCGVIRVGVTLSNAQIAETRNAAGVDISQTLQDQGWYLQVLDAAPITRQARRSPPCNFWYMDGESVQQIVLNSTLIQ